MIFRISMIVLQLPAQIVSMVAFGLEFILQLPAMLLCRLNNMSPGYSWQDRGKVVEVIALEEQSHNPLVVKGFQRLEVSDVQQTDV